MNHFLKVKLYEKDRFIHIRPEHISTVEARDDGLTIVAMTNADVFWVESGQFSLNDLVNHTGHAGVRALK